MDLVLFSGGVDSLVLAAEAIAEGRLGLLLHVVYAHPAQSHERRAVSAATLAWHKLGLFAPVMEVHLPLSADALSVGVGAPGARPVPGRNLAMLSLAVNVAAARGLGRVLFGATAADRDGYPDCRPDFVAAVAALSAPWGVEVAAPLLSATRAEVLRRGAAVGAPLGSAWSCYQPADGRPCGSCGSCSQAVTR
jgi:7-cyano-7-deazaguanine synthase